MAFDNSKSIWASPLFNKAKCPGSSLACFAAAMRDIVIDNGDNWKIIGYIDFTLTDHTEGAPNSKSDKLGKIVWYARQGE